MAQKGTAMDVKLAAAIGGAVRSGEVAAFCREHRMSRQTFYKWKRRFEAEGRDGLEERSRRPLSSPGQTSMAMEEDVVRLRKELADFGTDAGPWSIRQRLLAADGDVPPSEATIWRILKRRGLIVPEPKKRPRVSWHRFCWERPNDLWQMDATHWSLVTAVEVEIINQLDDNSRLCAGSQAVPTCTSERAWDAFEQAGSQWGLPARVLTDNGLCFSGARRRKVVSFETNLRHAGVLPIVSSPYHPQTCGKVERFHQTLKLWLSRQQPAAATIAELQTQLDRFVAFYNFERPHRALGGATPASVWEASPRAVPAEHPITDTTTLTRHLTVNNQGVVRIAGHSIAVGCAYRGCTVTVATTGLHCVVFNDNQMIRALIIDPTRYYQPSGNRYDGSGRLRLTQ
jgi:transposase InsO family protein